MKRKEIKKVLKVLGISEKLIEMPAVMERIYRKLERNSKEEIIDLVSISDGGKKVVVGKELKFIELENGEVKCGDSIIIDKYGMDKSYAEEDMFSSSSYMTRTDKRQIKIGSYGNINATEILVEDDGDAILNYYNYTMLKEGSTPTLGWEGNKLYLTQAYPITKEWFRQREEEKETSEDVMHEENESMEDKLNEQATMQTIEDLVEQTKEQKEIIRMLEEKQEELKAENTELKDKNRKLQNMLNKVLQFCETVQKSKFGKFFFRKQLKALPEVEKYDEVR